MYNKRIFIISGIIFICLSNVVSLASSHTRIIVFNSQKELNRDSIRKRCGEFYNTPNEIIYLKKMFSLAEKKDSIALQGYIISNMIKNYYNRTEADSVEFWFNKLEKIALENKLYKEYFNSYNLLCAVNIYEQKFDKAIEKSNKLYLHAKELNNTDGLIASYENSGIIYMETYRYIEAVKAFNDGLNLLKKSEKRKYGYEFQITTFLIESYLKLRDYSSAKKSIESASEILKDWKKKNKNLPYDRCAWLIDCYYISMYVGLKQPQYAEKYIESAKQYVEKVNDTYVLYYFYYNSALYYQLIKDYSESLNYINKVLSIFIYQPALSLKGKVLLESGKYKEAALAYDFALNELDSTYCQSFSNQINQLRSIHEFDKLEIKNKELEIASRTLKLNIAIVSAIILLTISIFGFFYIIRIRKIRNQLRISDLMLKEDKRKLIQSEKALKAEKEKVEKSSHFKDIFLANMNHEVRTPLNAIVGFSSILTDLYKDETTLEYVNIIKYNTELLLKLINDTIDASSLQTGLLPFNYEHIELKSTCLSIIDEMKTKIKDGVSLKFVPDNNNEFYLKTDGTRLTQLLSNLLLNSIKFTDQGDIYLKYSVDEEKKEVIFTIEDTGRGIPEDMQNVIFESFQKVDVFKQGLGLGLTLVKLISTSLNGKVSIDPSYNNGTRIIFIHPIN